MNNLDRVLLALVAIGLVLLALALVAYTVTHGLIR